MSWTTVGSGSATWEAAAATARTWSTTTSTSGAWTTTDRTDRSWLSVTVPLIPPAWGQLSAVTDAGDGVDFRLTARQNYPIRVSSDRPAILRNTHEAP